MKMMNYVRHKVGLEFERSCRIKHVLVALLLAAFVLAFGNTIKTTVILSLVFMTVVSASSYLIGRARNYRVKQYLELIADEQEKVMRESDKAGKEWTKLLALAKHAPWEVYERLQRNQIAEILERHEQSDGASHLDIELTRAVRDIEDRLALKDLAQESGYTLDEEEAAELMASIREAIRGCDKFFWESQKVLAEAQDCLKQLG